MKLSLSPEVKLRDDKGRAILFSRNPGIYSEEPVFRFLYPHQAIILSFFNGKYDRKKIEEIISYLFNIKPKEASKEIDILINLPVNSNRTIKSLLVDISNINPDRFYSYDPKDFVISSSQIDMSDLRCKVPCSILFLPTMRCVTNCIYCYANRRGFLGKEMDLNLIKRIINEIQECEIESIQFSGGDFFCRKDAFDIIEYIITQGIYPDIATKYPLNRSQIEKLEKIGLFSIQISIDALNPSIIEYMVRTPAKYGEKILQTLNYLHEYDFKVRTNTVITPYNIDDAKKLAWSLAEYENVFKSNYNPYGRSLYNHRENLFLSNEDCQQFKNEIDLIKAEFPNKSINFSGSEKSQNDLADPALKQQAFDERAFCTANRRGVVILPNGQVTICEELYFNKNFIIGDLNFNSLLDIWNSSHARESFPLKKESILDGPCRTCEDYNQCNYGKGICVRDAMKAYGEDKFYYPDPRCPKAPIGNRLS